MNLVTTRIRRALLFGFLVFLSFMPATVTLAQLPENVDEVSDETGLPWDENLVTHIETILKFILSFAAILALAAVIIGGFYYILSFGNESRAGTGKRIIFYAVIGLLIIGASFLIIGTIGNIFFGP